MSRRDCRAQVLLWGIVVEGAVDAFAGRPASRNPYAKPSLSADAWDFGHEDATWLLELRGQEEAARWLREAV